MSRKGLIKKSKLIITGDSQIKGKFCYCEVLINSNIKKQIVSSLEHKDLIKKCLRYVGKVESIHVKSLKWYDAVIYNQ